LPYFRSWNRMPVERSSVREQWLVASG